MEALFVMGPGQVPIYTASALTAGTVTRLADLRAAIVPVDIPAGGHGYLAVDGLWKIPKASATVLTPGTLAYWDYSASALVTAPAAAEDYPVGVVVASPTDEPRCNANGDLFGLIQLNSMGGRTFARPVYDASMDATPGEVGEIAHEVSTGTLWQCTVASATAATWQQLDPKD